MNPTPLALILLSAGFHAAWNALVKTSQDKQAFIWLIHIPSLIVVAPFSLTATPDPIPPIGWAMILAR